MAWQLWYSINRSLLKREFTAYLVWVMILIHVCLIHTCLTTTLVLPCTTVCDNSHKTISVLSMLPQSIPTQTMNATPTDCYWRLKQPTQLNHHTARQEEHHKMTYFIPYPPTQCCLTHTRLSPTVKHFTVFSSWIYTRLAFKILDTKGNQSTWVINPYILQSAEGDRQWKSRVEVWNISSSYQLYRLRIILMHRILNMGKIPVPGKLM